MWVGQSSRQPKMHEERSVAEDLPPAAKRKRISDDGYGKEGSERLLHERRSTLNMSEFPASSLDDFYKPCPNYRLPVELGAFSFNSEGAFCHDRSQLRYYYPPSQPSRMVMDLRVGYDRFQPKDSGAPSLEPILRWISLNGHCFKPRTQLLSPNNNGEVASAAGSPPLNSPTSGERPDNLLTNFISWRGMLTKMLCSLYNHQEPWKVAATLHQGTIYLQEIETEEKRRREAEMPEKQREMSYWGLKFENYVTCKEPPTKVPPQSPSQASDKGGTVNPQQGYCSVIRTRMNTHSIVMVGEVDCCDHKSKEKPPQNYIELKTSRVILTDRNKASFRRHKLMKWWAQSFLVGVPKIICGFRNDEGVVKSLQSFRTTDIPKETQVDLTMWQPSVCLNFLDELLVWIRKSVVQDDPKAVYILDWKSPYTCVTCTECPPGSEYVFLPDWYIKKQPPSEN